jgi:hypothetical protein
MAAPDWRELQKKLDELPPEQKLELADYLWTQVSKIGTRPTRALGGYRGTIQLTVDPEEYQRSARAEWP